MKKTVLVLSSFIRSLGGFSQLRLVAEGPVFPELKGGFGKVLLLKDGTTAYLTGVKDYNCRSGPVSFGLCNATSGAYFFGKGYNGIVSEMLR